MANARMPGFAALGGLLFGAGLVFSGIADPARILAFLTLGPDWDPTLLVVMSAALAVAVPGYWLVNRRGRTVSGDPLPMPPAAVIDRRLLIGALIFGIGWGLGGYCPGPAIVSAGFGNWPALAFLPAMVVGAWLADRFPGKG